MLRSIVMALVLVVLVAGCGGGSDESGAVDLTSSARVASLEVGDVSCGSATTAPATVTWATEEATGVAIAVDDFTPKSFGASGSTDVVVPCDDESHEITVTPRNDSGPGEPETEDVSPR